MDEDGCRIRYYAEKRLVGSENIFLGAFSVNSTFLAVVKGRRVSVHAISGRACVLVYIQDSPAHASAIIWHADDTFITGYADGSFVTTVLRFSKARCI